MNLQYTSNNIPYQVNKVSKEVSLMPIEGIHDIKLVADTKLTLDVQYLDYEVYTDWQKP
jgi:hypothetical protein